MIKEFKDVDHLTPGDFEIFVRDVFLSAGWVDAEITKVGQEYRHGDGGVDIFAYKNKRKFAIEVKQRGHHNTVDIKALNQLVTGARLANVTYMILVTNSYFTSEVKTRALKLGVELFDRDRLQDLYIQRHSEIGREIKPRFYQQIIIDEAIRNFRAGKNKLLIEMATGLGKTYTAAHLLKRLLADSKTKPRVLFLAHQVEILLQSVTSFKNVLGISSYNYSACFSGVSPENTDFVFATFDTLHSKLLELKSETFTFIVVDEAHHAPAKTYADVIKHFSPELLIGLTATPFREDNQSVIDFFGGSGGHIGKYDLTWGLKNKYLAFPKYEVLMNDIDESKIAQLQIGLDIKDLDKILFLHKKDEEVVRIIEQTVEEKQIHNVKGIVFCRNIKHMRHLLNFFDLGTATCVHSQMKENERRDNIRNFREGGYKYILVCDLFNEGIDIPETNLLVFMRFTGSRRIWLQQLGRGLRKTKTKNFINVLDFVGSLERVFEIKQFESEIQNQSFDRKTENDDFEDDSVEASHDSSIQVTFSKSAADVLKLIDEYKLKLGFRENLIDRIRKHFEEIGNIPRIEQLEEQLNGISLNEISTCFDSYSNYLTIAFNSDDSIMEMFSSVVNESIYVYVDNFYIQWRVMPSFDAVENNFIFDGLCIYTKAELRTKFPDLLCESRLDLFSKENEGNKAHLLETQVDNNSESQKKELLEKYSEILNSLSDFRNLTDLEAHEIDQVFGSRSSFVKASRKLKND